MYTCFGQSCLSSGCTDCLPDDDLDWSKHVVTVVHTLYGILYCTAHCTVLGTSNCTISNKQPFVTCVSPRCFDLYEVVIRKVYTKAHKYSKLCQRCSYVGLKYSSFNEKSLKMFQMSIYQQTHFSNSEQ